MLESVRRRFSNIFSAPLENLGSEKSLLVTSKILVLFVHTLTAEEKCSLCNKDNLQQQIQMELCKKQKLLSQLSAAPLILTFNFQHFEKNHESHGTCFSKIIDPEGCPCLNV